MLLTLAYVVVAVVWIVGVFRIAELGDEALTTFFAWRRRRRQIKAGRTWRDYQ